jgi:hypothetical protein
MRLNEPIPIGCLNGNANFGAQERTKNWKNIIMD